MEIDENSQIISLVHSRPVLYVKCNDFRERNHLWKEIANILKVDVAWIKSRWHILRAKFIAEYSAELKGRRSNFKYFNEMTFLINHINVDAFDMHRKSSELEPAEFVITQKDLDETSDDDSSNIFVELEIENNSNKDMVQAYDVTAEMQDDGLEETFTTPNEEFSQANQHTIQAPYKQSSQSKVETFHILEIKEKNISRKSLKDDTRDREKPPEETKVITGDSEKCDVPVSENNPSTEISNKLSEQTESSQLSSMKNEKERCEDTIFGELVSATLRKMQSEKKKAVKREIMNILFT